MLHMHMLHLYLQNFLVKCIGMAGSKSCKTEFIIQAIDTLFDITHHTIENEREVVNEYLPHLFI